MTDPLPGKTKEKNPGEPRITQQPLIEGVRIMNGELHDLFIEADAAAGKNQEYHRLTATIAIAAGSLAIFFGIFQFGLLSIPLDLEIPFINVGLVELCRLIELVAIIIAGGAVIFGLWRSYQNRWLINRHIAERCRLLKFRSLLMNDFWDEAALGTWTKDLSQYVCMLREIRNNELSRLTSKGIWSNLLTGIRSLRSQTEEDDLIKEWLEKCKIPEAHTPGRCSYPEKAKAEFLLYYRKKRLEFQRDYYYRRHLALKPHNNSGNKLPLILFFICVGAVPAHFVIDFVMENNTGKVASIFLVGLGVILPFCGYFLKTYRDTFQVTRSSALYYAKYSALTNLESRLSELESSVDENWNQILATLWECENFLEAEHREWLNLVRDAEWFL